MAFWVFMLIMGLLIPLTMVGFGKLFLTKKHQYGFRLSNGDVHEEQGHMGVCS